MKSFFYSVKVLYFAIMGFIAMFLITVLVVLLKALSFLPGLSPFRKVANNIFTTHVQRIV